MNERTLPPRHWRILAIVVAVALQAVVGVPFTVASGLLAPGWAVVAFSVLWLAFTVVLVAVARRRPLTAPLVPLANGLVLVLALTAGDIWLGWTA
jgi:hypothetical protein